MTIKLITYDLNKPGQNHDKVLAKIKSYGNSKRLSESSYAVDSDSSPEEIFDDFEPLLDQNDCLLVIPVAAPYSGRNYIHVINWLNQKLEYIPQLA